MSENIIEPGDALNTQIKTSPAAGNSIVGRIAVYDNMRSLPRIINAEFKTIDSFISETPQKVYALSHEIGGGIPYTIIKEVIENLIHANFREIAITILNNGNHIIVSDQGPGVEDKEKAFLPGYTSATTDMKKHIRGVGSGLPIVKETITFSGGSVEITDNIKNGTVVSLKLNLPQKTPPSSNNSQENTSGAADTHKTPAYSNQAGSAELSVPKYKPLSLRQNKILFLIQELEECGPSKVAKELGFSLSTSYRELLFLEKQKLVTTTTPGKKKLSQKGAKYLDYYLNNF
jgi:predicted HTH transcriptional regulator